jgi:hypothetical protein
MAKVEISNPRLDGARYTSERQATGFVERGIAAWLPDGRLRFTDKASSVRRRAESSQSLREEAAEFARNRGERVYWNGARNYPGAAYPPGCNVSFPKNGTEAAVERYCS